MKLTVVIVSALIVMVLAKPAANKRGSFRGDEKRILKRALSVLHDVERRGRPDRGVWAYNAADESECAEKEVFCHPWGMDDSCMVMAVCDGHADCINGEDEANCEDFQCYEGTSKVCSTGNSSHVCIPHYSLCDGWVDCPEDHSDELGCTERADCYSDYECPDENTCLYDWDICDGLDNCLGGFDESNCTNDDFSTHDGSGSGSDKRALPKKEVSGSGSGSENKNGKLHFGSGSGSGKRGADVPMKASDKRMLTQELRQLLDALKED